MIADDFHGERLKDCDLIAGPVAPTVAWQLGCAHPLADHLADIFTPCPVLAGLPGMSIPGLWRGRHAGWHAAAWQHLQESRFECRARLPANH